MYLEEFISTSKLLFVGFGFLFLTLLNPASAQSLDKFSIENDELKIGGDIFNDFNEDLEAAKVIEDERFFRYGRFFSFTIGIGQTTFDGNRGAAYIDDPPSWGMGLNYFLDFQRSFGLGLEFSKHHMIFDTPTRGFEPNAVGLIDVSLLRVYFSYRYYIDTTNLGTAITYSNPFFIARLEYWYMSNQFESQAGLADESGGGLGLGVGGGLEFPISLRESYLSVEILWHRVRFKDKFTTNYAPPSTDPEGFGHDDLTGDPYTLMVSYVFNW